MITKHIINILRITPAIVPSPFGANSLINIINRFLELVNCLHFLLGANFSMLMRQAKRKVGKMFLSPSRGSIFSMKLFGIIGGIEMVSVPFRGFYLLNPPPRSPLFKPVPAPLCGGKKFLAILPEKTTAKKPATPVLMGCAGKITRCTPTVQFCTVQFGKFFHDIWYISTYAEMHHIPCHRHVYVLLEYSSY